MGNPFETKPFFVGGAESPSRDLKADGSVALTANWDVGAYTITALRFISDQATGTAPFTVASTTVVTNLNADLLDGLEGAAYSPVAGSTSIVTVGTVTTGTWSGTAIAADKGGTGQTVYAIGDLLYASSTSALSKLADVAVGQVLTSGGVGVAPAWSGNPSVASLVLTGTGTLASTAGNATFTTSLTAASGNEVALSLNYTTNKAAGDDTGLKIVQTDTASPGTSYLIDAQVATSSKFNVDNAGVLTSASYGSINSLYVGYGANKLIFRVAETYSSIRCSGTETNPTDIYALSTLSSGTKSVFGITPTYNQTGTAGGIDLIINRTETAVGSGTQCLIDAQVGSVSKFCVSNKGAVSSTLINNTDSDTDEIDSVVFAGGHGLVIAASITDGTSAVWKLKATTFEAVEVDADWTAVKDNASSYNVYIEGGAIKLQNKVGDNKAVKLGFYGV